MIRIILDWLEAWAPLIPLSVWLRYPHIYPKVRAVVIYFILAAAISTTAILEWKEYFIFRTDEEGGNGLFYNLHSMVRVSLFVWFTIGQVSRLYGKVIRVAFLAYLLFIVLIFYLGPLSVFHFNSIALTGEPILLLLAGVLYLFGLLNLDTPVSYSRTPAFWIIIGLLVFEASNFTIFMTYNLLSVTDQELAELLWDVPNMLFLIFALFSTRGFLAAKQ